MHKISLLRRERHFVVVVAREVEDVPEETHAEQRGDQSARDGHRDQS
ncbi:hypothetical protein [Streptomyces zhihengii]